MPDRQVTFPKPVYEWKTMEQTTSGDTTIVKQAWTFSKFEYFTAGSIFPTEGNVYVKYRTEDGTNQHRYLLDLPKSKVVSATLQA